MPINRRTLNELSSRLNLVSPTSVTKRELAVLLNQAMNIALDTAIPFDPPVIAVPEIGLWGRPQKESEDDKLGRSPRQDRYRLVQFFERLENQLDQLPPADGSFEAVKAITDLHRALQNGMRSLEWLVQFDQESQNFLEFRDSGVGRKKLARAIASAREQVGSKISEARPLIDAEMTIAYQENLEAYLNEQFPVESNESVRPTLNERDTLIMGREYYGAMTRHDDLDDATYRIMVYLGECVRDGRFYLPLVEGIFTEEYWRNAITNGFEDAPLRPNYSPLISGFTLQDRLPWFEVTQTLGSAAKTLEPNKENAVIHYLDGDSVDDFDQLAMLGTQTSENTILVVKDDQGEPVIVTPYHPLSPDLLKVIRPGHAGTLISAPISAGNPIDEIAQARLKEINRASGSMHRNLSPEQVSRQLDSIQKRWQSAIKANCPGKPEVLKKELGLIQDQLVSVAKGIVMPGYGGEDNLRNHQRFQVLAGLSRLSLESQKYVEFALPRGVGSMAAWQTPEYQLYRDAMGEPGSERLADVTLRQIDSDEPLSSKVVPTSETVREAQRQVLSASPTGAVIGETTKAFPAGLVSFKISPDWQGGLPMGHWLSESDYERIATVQARGIPFLKWKDVPIMDVGKGQGILEENGDFVSQEYLDDEANRKVASAVGLIHDDTLTPDQITLAADMALNECLMLTVNVEDQFGSKRTEFPYQTARHANYEDLRRFIIQQVTLSDLDTATKQTMCQRAATGNWQEAEDLVEDAHQAIEALEDELALGPRLGMG